MSETRRQVLQLLQDGKITADQALELLAAMESPEQPGETAEEVLTGDIIQPEPPPDMSRFRRFWQIPFVVSLGVLLIVGLILRSMYQSSNGALSLGFICVWSIFILAFGLTVLAFMSRRSAWLHVRVQERNSHRIAISLPLPLGLAEWGVKLAQNFVHEPDEQNKLSMAGEFIAEARKNMSQPGADPFMVHVDDDDGDKVQVFIG